MAKFVQTTLIDGYAGGPHVTEVQLGLAHQATFGPDDYVLEGGRKSEAQVLTNNSIRIFDAVYCIQGRRDVIPASGYNTLHQIYGCCYSSERIHRCDHCERYTRHEPKRHHCKEIQKRREF